MNLIKTFMENSRTTLLIAIMVATLLPTTIFSQVKNSQLADGDIYKFEIKQDGIYRLDYAFLEELGVNPTTIDPRNIKILGHGGGHLPEANADERIDDLAELGVWVQGQNDGSFDQGDYILMYGEGIDRWQIDPANRQFDMEKNPYEEANSYFLKIASTAGKRLETRESLEGGNYTVASFNAYQRHELEQFNLLFEANDENLQGSGRLWVGDHFHTTRSKDFSPSFDFSQAILSQPFFVKMHFVARSGKTSGVTLRLGTYEKELSIFRANVEHIEADYAKKVVLFDSLFLQSTNPEITIEYPNLGNNNEGWLDYLQFNFRQELTYTDRQLICTDLEAPVGVDCRYQIESSVDVEVWDITDRINPTIQSTHKIGDQFQFVATQTPSSTYAIFGENDVLVPEATGKIENQNLHALEDIEYLIIYHPAFEEAALKLYTHRKEHSRLNVAMADIHQVFNEFSSGKTDPTAIRDFARMLYDRSEGFQYLTLFGDGSFDYRHIYKTEKDESFIPVYETERSLHPIESFPSDDYYALLDPQEGGSLRGALDIAVGRIPVRTAEEADIVVNKIIKYETDEDFLGDWRINLLFVADDEDTDRHFLSADNIAQNTGSRYPVFNSNKVYIDAYEQENTPGGVFNFNAAAAITNNIFKGQLVVNYIGHGGSNGWAQERILRKEDIDQWNNPKKLPVLITATCSFAGYDNPKKITAGEYTITHPNGGSIALLTTVRAVYALSNERLTRAVYDHIFKEIDGKRPTLGQIMVNAKNSNSADTSGTNARKFTLLGDPALTLAAPVFISKTTRINGKNIEDANLDTLKALSKVEIEGEVLDRNGQIATQFNGKIYPTIFDKSITLKTLGQDKGSSERSYQLQKNIIFKGLASVTAGRFKFSFVVPKDINYAIGKGKISYYAEDGSQLDAAGAYDQVHVGGTNENAIDDKEGPEIEIFMNDESFVFGGITDPNPVLLVNLRDDNGINVIGNSIGHDLTGVLNQDLQSTILLNDFYEAAQDDYTRGVVRYPMSNLEPGKQTIAVKAWDIANNSSESLLEFLVVNDEESGLRHVLNYPNPFSTNTLFQFEHSLQDQDLDIVVEILNTRGRLVKRLETSIKSSGYLSRDVVWDGRDDFGDSLANGIYVYRITVSTVDNTGRILKNTSDLQKLVILR